ncbi:hypothetical protein CAS74_004841 [Pichia kudriavzevii]|uniref:Uncharacterized protein n=1 Tax=Pichia kudriavzevii TaxID=4909 RepID=A0A1Z8JHN8_PICKU|nr:hypothetical protein CAS74_004841 [Pichia kudriavzevii]
MAVTPLKFMFGVALVAVPLFATTFVTRPSFANAINNHLIQEEMEARRQHNYKTDHYEMLAEYAAKGKGKVREFTPTSGL